MAQAWLWGLQNALSLCLVGLPEGETKAQLGSGCKEACAAGVAEPLLDPCRQILEVYWKSSNSLQGGKKGHLNKQLPLQVKMALVINGEFLVSVSSGWAAGPWYLGGGWGRPPPKGPQMWCWTSQGEGPEASHREMVLSRARAREGRSQVQPGGGPSRGVPGGQWCS